jgi:transcription-repair coupling factor (superfamily II helicase)
VKQGAQFTPQGVLRYPIASKDPVETVLEIRLLLDELIAEQPAIA